MAIVKDFYVKKTHPYVKENAWFTRKAFPDGQDNSEAEAKKEFNKQLTEAVQQHGPILQVLEYHSFRGGGGVDEGDNVVDGYYLIRSTVLFSR